MATDITTVARQIVTSFSPRFLAYAKELMTSPNFWPETHLWSVTSDADRERLNAANRSRDGVVRARVFWAAVAAA